MTQDYHGQRFFVRPHGRRLATPLLLVLILVEASDVLFAVDSIPAVLAITRDPFIVYTSNAFAVLGLRSLYLLLATVIPRIRYLKYGLAAILVFVGVKMLLMDIYEISTAASLVAVALLMTASVLASLSRAPHVSPGDIAPNPQGNASTPERGEQAAELVPSVPCSEAQSESRCATVGGHGSPPGQIADSKAAAQTLPEVLPRM